MVPYPVEAAALRPVGAASAEATRPKPSASASVTSFLLFLLLDNMLPLILVGLEANKL